VASACGAAGRDLLLDWALPAVLGVLWACGNLAFLTASPQYVPMGDAPGHVGRVWVLGRTLVETPWPWWPLQAYLFVGNPAYPPLLYWLAAALGLLLSLGPVQAGLLAVQLFWPLLSVACYRLGRGPGGRWGGWLAALLALGSPVALETSRVFMLDVPLGALVAAALAFGLFSALAVLVKTTAVVFLGPAVLATLVRRSRHPVLWAGGLVALLLVLGRTRSALVAFLVDLPSLTGLGLVCALAALLALAALFLRRRRARVPANLTEAALLATLLAGPWYGAFSHHVVGWWHLRDLTAPGQLAAGGVAPVHLHLEPYGYDLALSSAGGLLLVLPGTLLVLSGLSGVRPLRQVPEMAASFLGGLLLLGAMPVFNPRHLLGILPAAVALAVAGAARLGRWRPLAVGVAQVCAVLAAFGWSVPRLECLPPGLAAWVRPRVGSICELKPDTWEWNPVPLLGLAPPGPDDRLETMELLLWTAARVGGGRPLLVEWRARDEKGIDYMSEWMSLRALQEDLPTLYLPDAELMGDRAGLRVAHRPPGHPFPPRGARTLYLSSPGPVPPVRMSLWWLRQHQSGGSQRFPLHGPAPRGFLVGRTGWLPLPAHFPWPAYVNDLRL